MMHVYKEFKPEDVFVDYMLARLFRSYGDIVNSLRSGPAIEGCLESFMPS
jgi:hypothetical protein